MRPLEFYEVVEVLDAPVTQGLRIAGLRGIVTGVPPYLLGIEGESGSGDPDEAQYSIEVGQDGYAVARKYLNPTGERVSREALYDGTAIAVDLSGNRIASAEATEDPGKRHGGRS